MTFPERPLERVTVNDVMHTGILMTNPETPLKTVARLMADRKVHAVAVADTGSALGPFGIISTLDIAAAVASGEDLTAADASRGDVITVRADEQLESAASLMVEKKTEHLLVINPATGHAEGVLSALDVAGAYGARP
jgi:predicted transcriptional regulator